MTNASVPDSTATCTCGRPLEGDKILVCSGCRRNPADCYCRGVMQVEATQPEEPCRACYGRGYFASGTLGERTTTCGSCEGTGVKRIRPTIFAGYDPKPLNLPGEGAH